MSGPEPPELTAYAHDGLWVIWCSRCGRWHYHTPGGGYHVAHCQGLDGHRGYVLTDGGAASPEVLEAIRRAEAPP
jgi:hypothetical protein